MLFYLHVATLDINATEVVFGEDLSEKDGIYFLSSEKKSKNIVLESGKLFSELASTYIYFDSQVLLRRSIYYLCGVCHYSYEFENPFGFQNTSILF